VKQGAYVYPDSAGGWLPLRALSDQGRSLPAITSGYISFSVSNMQNFKTFSVDSGTVIGYPYFSNKLYRKPEAEIGQQDML